MTEFVTGIVLIRCFRSWVQLLPTTSVAAAEIPLPEPRLVLRSSP
jgi:hypothetical protein